MKFRSIVETGGTYVNTFGEVLFCRFNEITEDVDEESMYYHVKGKDGKPKTKNGEPVYALRFGWEEVLEEDIPAATPASEIPAGAIVLPPGTIAAAKADFERFQQWEKDQEGLEAEQEELRAEVQRLNEEAAELLKAKNDANTEGGVTADAKDASDAGKKKGAATPSEGKSEGQESTSTKK